MGGLAPGLGPVDESWPIARARVAVAFLLGRVLERARLCSHAMTRGLDMRVLDGVNAWSWEAFWMGCGFFSWGGGGGEEENQGTTADTFSHTTRVQNGPVIFYI